VVDSGAKPASPPFYLVCGVVVDFLLWCLGWVGFGDWLRFPVWSVYSGWGVGVFCWLGGDVGAFG